MDEQMHIVPQVSVIIPTYNRRELLLRSVRSVLAQAGVTLEVIVVDDGSDDGTVEAVEAMGDDRVRCVRASHGGACAARNIGLREARGQYVAFQDSDDVFRPGKLATQVRQLTESGADAVFCRFCRHVDEAETLIPGDETAPGAITHEALLMGNKVSTQTILGTRASLLDTSFDERFPRLQDWELVLRYTQKYRLIYFDDVLVDVYEQADSISRAPEKALAALRMLFARYRAEYRQSGERVLSMLDALQIAANGCGGNIWRECAALLSPRAGMKANLIVLRRLAGQLYHRIKDGKKGA